MPQKDTSWAAATTLDPNAIYVHFPSLLNNDRPLVNPPALTHIH